MFQKSKSSLPSLDLDVAWSERKQWFLIRVHWDLLAFGTSPHPRTNRTQDKSDERKLRMKLKQMLRLNGPGTESEKLSSFIKFGCLLLREKTYKSVGPERIPIHAAIELLELFDFSKSTPSLRDKLRSFLSAGEELDQFLEKEGLIQHRQLIPYPSRSDSWAREYRQTLKRRIASENAKKIDKTSDSLANAKVALLREKLGFNLAEKIQAATNANYLKNSRTST